MKYNDGTELDFGTEILCTEETNRIEICISRMSL
jgi:hypothetical protein